MQHQARIEGVANGSLALATVTHEEDSIKEIMAPGSVDGLTKEMIYLAVSVTNGSAILRSSQVS